MGNSQKRPFGLKCPATEDLGAIRAWDAMKNLFLRSAIVVAIGASVTAHAADMPVKAPITPTPPIESWTFSLTPYLWATSLNGSTTVKGRTIDVDASFIDIVEHTEIPKNLFQLAALGEARYGRFALLTDLIYMKVGLGASITRSRGTDAIGGTGGASAGLTVKMFIGEAAAALGIAPLSWALCTRSTTALDLYAGGPAWGRSAGGSFAASR